MSNLHALEDINATTEDLVSKFTEIAENAELDSETILHEQGNDPILQKVGRWVKTGQQPNNNSSIRQSKALQACRNLFALLFLEPSKDLLIYSDANKTGGTKETKIFLPISLFLKCFELAHSHPLSGHMGFVKTFDNIRRNFF